MEKDIFEQIRRLGFSEEFIENTRAFLPIAGPRFTMSERRQYGEQDMKFAALLYYNEPKEILALRWYHAIDVSEQNCNKWMPKGNDAMTWLHIELDQFDFNAKTFIRTKEMAQFQDKEWNELADQYYECLYNSKGDSPEIRVAKEMLKKNYIDNTIFSTLRYPQQAMASSYAGYFPTLTIEKETGFVTLDNAAKLVLEKNITNDSTLAVITQAINELDTKPGRARKRITTPSTPRQKKSNRISK